ncbi:MAG TPA: hypothetical protein VGG10_09170 [Rhizomicrobium sp.]
MNRACTVIDDFLPRQDNLDLWTAFQVIVQSPAKARDWNRTYRLVDGDSPAGSGFSARKAIVAG